MMRVKFLFILFLLNIIFCINTYSSPYFTYYGPTTVTVPYGSNSVQASYDFYYYNMGGLYYPCLVVSLDGNVISNDLCHNPSTPSSFNITFTPGTHTVQFSLLSINGGTLNCYDELSWQENSFSVTAKFKVRSENIFSGGTIYVDNLTTPKTAPYDRTSFTSDNFQIGAIDQSNCGYNWIWNTSGINNSKWEKIRSGQNPVDYSYSRNTSYSVQSNDNSTRLKAVLKKVLNNVIFQNSFVGVGNGGVIKVNGTQYNSPKTADGVVELNPVTGETVTQTINGIRYNLDHWSDGSTFPVKTFYPASNITYTAYYIGKPSNANRNLHNNIAYGQPITLVWNENPNTNVTQYQIWRKVKHNGVVSEPVLLATKNRGTLTYTDNEYSLTNGYTDDLLWYDVRGYYTVENTYADPEWLAIYGEIIPKQSDSIATAEKLNEFSVTSFPNPFNPSTKIQVILPGDDHLQVTVFNSIGERIIELKNENLTKATYEIIWDGKDSKSMQVNSGIYFVVVKTGTKMTTQKLVLLK